MKILLITIFIVLPAMLFALPSVALVTDIAGIHDQSFNENAYQACLKLKKEKIIGKFRYEEPTNKMQMMSDLSGFASQNKTTYIIVSGYDFQDATDSVSTIYPHQKFLGVDILAGNKNVETVFFNRKLAGQQAATVAMKVAPNMQYGYIGGMHSIIIDEAWDGFNNYLRALYLPPFSQFLPSFTDVQNAKTSASFMYHNGARVIFAYCGPAQIGVINEAKAMGNGYYVIAADRDQSYLAPKHVVASILEKPYPYFKEMITNFKGGKTIDGKTTIKWNKRFKKCIN